MGSGFSQPIDQGASYRAGLALRTVVENRRREYERKRKLAKQAKRRRQDPVTKELEELRARAQAAVRRAESRTKGLWYDGRPRFPVDEHMSRLAEIRAEARGVLTEIGRIAAREAKEGRERVEGFRLDKPGVLSSTAVVNEIGPSLRCLLSSIALWASERPIRPCQTRERA